MIRPLHTVVSWAVVGLMLTSGITGFVALSGGDAEARGFRSSRFRSSRRSWGGSSRRRSTYRPSTRRSAPSTRPPTRRRSVPSGTRSTTTTRGRRPSSTGSSAARTLYRANQARRMTGRGSRYGSRRMMGGTASRLAYRRAASMGLAFATYALARDHFARTHLSRYPVGFAAEPAPRPSYVPATSEVNGEQRPVVWSSTLQSYAVQKNGKLVPYDLKADRAATSSLMATAGYYWGPKGGSSSVRSSSSGGWFWLIALAVGAGLFVFLLIVAFVVLRAIKRSLLGATPKAKSLAASRQALAPPPGIRHDDAAHPDYWMQLAVDDFVVIHDFQAFEDALDGPAGVRYGDDFRVASLVRFRGATGAWDAVLAELQQIGEQPLFLLAWREGGPTHLSVYYAPNGFKPGTRTELLDRDETWLFEEPTRDDWRPGELAFNHEVTHVGTAADGTEVEQAFTQLPGGEAAAGATPEPGPRTLEAATVMRWRCAAAEKNPLMLVTELGAGPDMAGGQLRLWLGTPVDRREVEVTPAKIRS